MSWWVSLCCPCCGNNLQLDEPHSEGGTYAFGGTSEATLNVTYNYQPNFQRVGLLPGLREALDGKTATDTVELLKSAVEKLGTDEADDYWPPTDGNARKALVRLVSFAEEHPTGVWRVH